MIKLIILRIIHLSIYYTFVSKKELSIRGCLTLFLSRTWTTIKQALTKMVSTEDALDSLALRRLLLLESLLKKKQLLAEYAKNGFFQLGKARYALGGHAVSALRIPEGDVTATAKTICNSQSLDSCPQPNIVRQLVTVPDVWETSQNTSPKPSNDVDELAHKISESSIIADGSHEESSVESRGTIDNSSLEDNDKVANKKPINWFSALPPQSLRQAQTCFVSSLQLAAACVSMQEELDVLNQHYLEAKKL